MASSTTTTITLRVPNEDARALREMAGELDAPPTTLGAALIRYAITGKRREQLLQAIELLEQAQEHPPEGEEFRRLVVDAIEWLEAGGWSGGDR